MNMHNACVVLNNISHSTQLFSKQKDRRLILGRYTYRIIGADLNSVTRESETATVKGINSITLAQPVGSDVSIIH